MFMDTWICGFQIILNTTKVHKNLIEILNLWIVLLTKYRKLNVQQITMISQLRDMIQPKVLFCCLQIFKPERSTKTPVKHNHCLNDYNRYHIVSNRSLWRNTTMMYGIIPGCHFLYKYISYLRIYCSG